MFRYNERTLTGFSGTSALGDIDAASLIENKQKKTINFVIFDFIPSSLARMSLQAQCKTLH